MTVLSETCTNHDQHSGDKYTTVLPRCADVHCAFHLCGPCVHCGPKLSERPACAGSLRTVISNRPSMDGWTMDGWTQGLCSSSSQPSSPPRRCSVRPLDLFESFFATFADPFYLSNVGSAKPRIVFHFKLATVGLIQDRLRYIPVSDWCWFRRW